ncbi:hypothetical protein [Ferrovibrio xuzhouensis]
MSFRKIIKNFLPHGLYRLAVRHVNRRAEAPVVHKLLAANRNLHNAEAGQRCFILGNGPSVKALDLSLLAGQTVFSVSNGYLHDDYDRIRPRYHCVPQITYGLMTEDDVVRWFDEMHESIGDAILFLSDTEAELIQRHRLFSGRTVHYLALRDDFDDLQSRRIIDLANPVPRVESVPIMVLMIAMYLGFREIVLLGVDHDHFKSGLYQYAFEPKALAGKDCTVGNDGKVTISRYDDFQSLARLWRQYRALRQTAEQNGIRILNATPGGELDEFLRVDFADILGRRINEAHRA